MLAAGDEIVTVSLAPASDTGEAGDLVTSATTPTFIGTATPGSKVQVWRSGPGRAELLGTATASKVAAPGKPAGFWSLKTAATKRFSPGVWQIGAGISGPTVTLSMTIDNAVPAAPKVSLASSSDTGISATDRVTRLSRPMFTGEAEPGANVTIYAGKVALGSATASDQGRFEVTASTPLKNGSAVITARAKDLAGNVSPSSPSRGNGSLSITVDATEPKLAGTPVVRYVNGNEPNTGYAEVVATFTEAIYDTIDITRDLVLHRDGVRLQSLAGTTMTGVGRTRTLRIPDQALGRYGVDYFGGAVFVLQFARGTADESVRDQAGNAFVPPGLNSPLMTYTVPGYPRSPTEFTALAGDRKVTLSWQSPPAIAGLPVTSYTVGSITTGEAEWRTMSVKGTTTSVTIDNLANGTEHYFFVYASNLAGDGVSSNVIAATPASPPSAPGIPRVTAGDGEAYVWWDAPSFDGGIGIDRYVVQVAAEQSGFVNYATVVGDPSTMIQGLVNDRTYRVRVVATNAAGPGNPGAETSFVPRETPRTSPPSAPGMPMAIPGDGRVSLSWSAPSSSGTAAIRGYNVYASHSGFDFSLLRSVSGAGQLSTAVDGLVNGRQYTFAVAAYSDAGSGPLSPSVTGTPLTTVSPPAAPRSLSAVPEPGAVTLSWAPPAADGNGPITNYVVYLTSDTEFSRVYGTTAQLSMRVSGLVDGKLYLFRVAAVNTAGTGAQTDAVAVRPGSAIAAPGAARNVTVVAGDGMATVEWLPPLSNGGDTSVLYDVYYIPAGSTVFSFLGTTATTRMIAAPLTNGVVYGFQVIAKNSAGPAAPSPTMFVLPSPTVVPPGPPTRVAATVAPGKATVSWSAPTSSGNGNVTGYRATATHVASQAVVASYVLASSAASVTFDGLTPGARYVFRVRAINGAGDGAEASTSELEVPGSIGPAVILSARAGDRQASIAWSAPGGAAVLNYTVQYAANGSSFMNASPTTNTSSTVPGLTNRTPYQVRVLTTATNGAISVSEPTWVLPVATVSPFAGGSVTGMVTLRAVKSMLDVYGALLDLQSLNEAAIQIRSAIDVLGKSIEQSLEYAKQVLDLRDGLIERLDLGGRVVTRDDLKLADNALLDGLLTNAGYSWIGAVPGGNDWAKLDAVVNGFYESLVRSTLSGAQSAFATVPFNVVPGFGPVEALMGVTMLGITAGLESGVIIAKGGQGMASDFRGTLSRFGDAGLTSAISAIQTKIRSGQGRAAGDAFETLVNQIRPQFDPNRTGSLAKQLADKWSSFRRTPVAGVPGGPGTQPPPTPPNQQTAWWEKTWNFSFSRHVVGFLMYSGSGSVTLRKVSDDGTTTRIQVTINLSRDASVWKNVLGQTYLVTSIGGSATETIEIGSSSLRDPNAFVSGYISGSFQENPSFGGEPVRSVDSVFFYIPRKSGETGSIGPYEYVTWT